MTLSQDLAKHQSCTQCKGGLVSSTWKETLLKTISGDFLVTTSIHLFGAPISAHINNTNNHYNSCINIKGQSSSIPCLFCPNGPQELSGWWWGEGVSDSWTKPPTPTHYCPQAKEASEWHHLALVLSETWTTTNHHPLLSPMKRRISRALIGSCPLWEGALSLELGKKHCWKIVQGTFLDTTSIHLFGELSGGGGERGCLVLEQPPTTPPTIAPKQKKHLTSRAPLICPCALWEGALCLALGKKHCWKIFQGTFLVTTSIHLFGGPIRTHFKNPKAHHKNHVLTSKARLQASLAFLSKWLSRALRVVVGRGGCLILEQPPTPTHYCPQAKEASQGHHLAFVLCLGGGGGLSLLCDKKHCGRMFQGTLLGTHQSICLVVP